MSAPDAPPEATTPAVGPSPELETWLRGWLAFELKDDRHARLDGAPTDPTARARLAHVFVDVAIEGDREDGRGRGALDVLLHEADEGVVVGGFRVGDGRRIGPAARRRYVVVGGPGQGKSTLTQQLAQVHRALLLEAHREALDATAQRVLDETRAQVAAAPWGRPEVLRLPFVVPLGALSRWRATHDEGEGIVDFLVERVALAGVRVTKDELTAALSRTPSLLLLDGLDEVPAAAGRSETLALIEGGLQALSAAPILVVGTTRPGGYQGDFGEARELRLTEFSRPDAFTYAAHLADEWFPEEPSARRELAERIRLAANDPNTARLLGTPLHVSILSALLYRSPVAPRERWQLFHDFFDAIYKREQNPQRPHAALLGNHRRNLVPIHHRAGLHLQVLGETAKGTEALLTRAELARIIDARLQEERFTEDKRRPLLEQILEAAADRLVLLSQVRDGYFGFSLRSIQEFMAAEALTSGAAEAVARRLRLLAPLPYWRNVVLLAVSKALCGEHAFAPAVDTFVMGLCDAVRDDAPPGEDAVLAADILLEGSARSSPVVTEALVVRALGILDQPDTVRATRVGQAIALAAASDAAEAVRALVEPRLRRGANDSALEVRVPAWALLLALVEARVSWAREVAEAAWPTVADERRSVAQALQRVHVAGTTWLSRKVADDLETFGPGEVGRPSVTSGMRHAAVLRWWRHVEDSAPTLRVRLTNHVSWRLPSLRAFAAPTDVLDALATLPRWREVLEIARFSSSPFASGLAEALRWFAAEQTPAIWRREARDLPWPLGACLLWVESPEEARALADAAESGLLGGLADWVRAEARWQRSEIDFDELVVPSTDLPWSQEIASAGFIPWVARLLDSTWNDERADDRFERDAQHALAVTLAHAATSPRYAASEWVARVLVQLAESDPTVSFRLPSSDLRRIAATGSLTLEAALRFGPRDDLRDLVELLDATHAELVGIGFPNDPIFDRLLAAYPRSPGLLHLAKDGVWFDWHAAITIPDNTWTSGEPLAPAERAALAVLEVAYDRAVEPRVLADALLADENAPYAALARAHGSLRRGALLASELLARLTPEQRDLRARCIEVLLAAQASRRSELLVPSVWSGDLALPRPSPPEPAGVDDAPPVRLARVSVRGLRVLGAVDIPPDEHPTTPPSTSDGQWVVLLGENGVGKSTLLRAMTLALAEPDYANALFTESAERAAWRASGVTAGSAFVDLDGQTYTATVEEGDTGREVVRCASDPPNGSARERPFVVAYGCRRGAADGGRDQKVTVEPLDGVGTLFDAPGRALVIAEAWLKDLALSQLQNEAGSAHLYDVVREALIGARQPDGTWRDGVLPGVRAMTIREGRVWFEGPEVGRSPLAGLSDGYITTLGWVVDLMARWIHHRRKRKEPVSRGFLGEMRGVVLIDEVDLHLHPRWQKELIPAVRGVFPRLSFVVTTHNPLTVIGAREGEVFVLRRPRGEARVEAKRLRVPVGLRADQVLTGEWFGLATTLDPETFELWERHYRALRGGAKAGDPSVVELERQLRQRLGTYASTALERIALDVAAEVMGDAPQQLTAAEREVARARILAWTRERSGA